MSLNKHYWLLILIAGFTLFTIISFTFQQKEPWTPGQLLAAQELAITLNDPKAKQPLVLSVGPDALIRNSVDIGPAQDSRNLAALRRQLVNVSKDEAIVIYCGCCPFDKCPNIRPAFNLLNEMNFRNHKLLDIPRNLKVDWIDHDYPVND